ncbi:hypothetical protein [Cupriavidus taiwanensis]|uniref:hypothetical protein n=1 Tax=Cupriavidus taiwanensis TaxID=164546 RepID=UPI000E1176E4|nr:hypothetical protein [Cupriavidus taiwanensis]SOZ97321.1 hypothetical protein CBM2598_U70013 [Cupriavidus taiwanensis]
MTIYRECLGCGYRAKETEDTTFFDSVSTPDGHYFQCPACTSKNTRLVNPGAGDWYHPDEPWRDFI